MTQHKRDHGIERSCLTETLAKHGRAYSEDVRASVVAFVFVEAPFYIFQQGIDPNDLNPYDPINTKAAAHAYTRASELFGISRATIVKWVHTWWGEWNHIPEKYVSAETKRRGLTKAWCDNLGIG